MPVLFTSTIILTGFLYFILVIVGDNMLAFYAMSSLLLILVVPFGALALLPEKILIDTSEESIKNYVGKWKISEFPMRKISSVKYGVTNKGYATLIIVKKDGTTFSIGSWLFREEDIKAAFDEISPYSEKYGFDVKESIEGEYGGFSGEAVPSKDDMPYKVK